MTYYSVSNPYPLILGLLGTGLNGGRVFIGLPNQDPQAFPQAVYWDAAGTQPADQSSGIATIGGYISNSGTPAAIYTASPFSIRIRDAQGVQVYYAASINSQLADFIASLAAAAGASLVGFSHSASYSAGTVGKKLQQIVNIKDAPYNAAVDGTTDDTAAVQAAHDALTAGGTIRIPQGTCRISQVNITNPNITIELDPAATIKKYGSGGASTRGIFKVANLLNAYFTLTGGTIDLNGEGPMGIGTAGRIANTYAAQTIPAIVGLSGPANAAVYGLRTSHITVDNVTIKNTGESGILFRNCSDTLVIRSRFSNIANFGVEHSIVASGSDGGSGTMPDRARCYVRECYFEDIDDYCLGSGNGVAVGGGGAGSLGAMRDYEVTDCKFERCQRDVHFELSAGSWLESVKLTGLRSRDARQGSIGLVGARELVLDDIIIKNPGYAPSVALCYTAGATYPDIYGIVLSADFARVTIGAVEVIDNRNTPVFKATDGAISSGSAVFTSASASFTSADVGTFIGIVGAGPSGICHVARIVSRDSATQVTLDLAARTTVSGATWAYRGCTREPLILKGGSEVLMTGPVQIEGGVGSGLTSEPNANGIRVQTMSGKVTLSGLRMTAPTTTGTVPAGIRMIDAFAGKLELDPRNTITGYTAKYVGIYTYRASTIPPVKSTASDQAVVQSATLNTYGTEVLFTPSSDFFSAIQSISAEIASIGVETVTVGITAYFFDSGAGTTLEKASASNTTWQLTAKEIAGLNPDGAHIFRIGFKAKSSINSSTALIKVNATALQS